MRLLERPLPALRYLQEAAVPGLDVEQQQRVVATGRVDVPLDIGTGDVVAVAAVGPCRSVGDGHDQLVDQLHRPVRSLEGPGRVPQSLVHRTRPVLAEYSEDTGAGGAVVGHEEPAIVEDAGPGVGPHDAARPAGRRRQDRGQRQRVTDRRRGLRQRRLAPIIRVGDPDQPGHGDQHSDGDQREQYAVAFEIEARGHDVRRSPLHARPTARPWRTCRAPRGCTSAAAAPSPPCGPPGPASPPRGSG